jgi:nicotinamidase-related amidase
MTGNKRNWDQFALLLIDVQNDFWPEQIEQAFPHFKENIVSLLDLCRQEGIEVIHLRARFQADKADWMPIYRLGRKMPCINGTGGVDILAEASELPGELIFEKQSFDSFLMQELEPHLQRYNKRFLLTAGLVTSICVFLTTVSAMQRGYLTAIIEDCCADELAAHKHTLDRYSFMFERVTVAQLLSQHQQWLEMIEEVEQ